MNRRSFLSFFGLASVPAVGFATGIVLSQDDKPSDRQRMTVEEILRKLWKESYGDTPFPEIVQEYHGCTFSPLYETVLPR